MNQLRYLKDCVLCSRTRTVQSNGAIKETFADISTYKVQEQDVLDEVSASIYGADISRMLRINSPHNDLENYLISKVNFTQDNITNYAIKLGNFVYEITSVKTHWIDIKPLCEISQNSQNHSISA